MFNKLLFVTMTCYIYSLLDRYSHHSWSYQHYVIFVIITIIIKTIIIKTIIITIVQVCHSESFSQATDFSIQ